VVTNDRRKDTRMSLSLPVRVQGTDPDGATWEEMTSSGDTSFTGASFALKHPVLTGHVLNLSLPLPKSFRRYDLSEPSYRIFGLVRDVSPAPSGGGARVGVLFLGRHPPRGYEKNPAGRYLLPSDPAPGRKERRQFQRLDIYFNLKLCRIEGAADGGPKEEQTIAENLGKGGARVLTSMPLVKGEIVMVEEVGGPFRTRAEIRNVYIGKDHVPRLNLRFIDSETPDRLIALG
jgi:hypothetical protein